MRSLHFAQELVLKAPHSRVWSLFQDPQQLFALVPGVRETRVVEDQRRYAAEVQESLGPFRVRFQLDIEITGIEEGRSLAARVSGKDALGSTLRQDLYVALEATGEDETRIRMTTDVALMGKLAGLGASIVQRKAQSLMEAFAANIRAALEGTPDEQGV